MRAVLDFVGFVGRWASRGPLVLAVAMVMTAAFAGSAAWAGEPISDPFPKPIPASKTKVKLQMIDKGLTMPLWLVGAGDGSGRLFVIDQPGQMWVIKDGKRLPTPAADFSDRMVAIKKNFDERGLLGLAFHPGFADKNSPGFGKVYTCTSDKPVRGVKSDFPLKGVKIDHQCVIAEWQFKADNPNVIAPPSRREVMRFDQPQFNHNGGGIAFGHDGMLYIGVGDGGNAHDKGPGHGRDGNGQNRMTVLGTVLRIDPLGRTGKPVKGRYSVPDDNPFVGDPKGLDVIWAYGLRNPYRLSVDRKDGRIITGDVGQGMIEEVDIIVRGGNYGWRIMEGSFYFDASEGHEGEIHHKPLTDQTLPKMINPAVEYDHDEGISVIGGFVYRGKAIPSLAGKYVFGEWKRKGKQGKGRLLVADLKTGAIEELFHADGSEIGQYVSGMGEDDDGEIYLLTSGSIGPQGQTGRVYQIMPGE